MSVFTGAVQTPGEPFFSVCGQICGQRVNVHDGQAKGVAEMAGFWEISSDFAGINPPISMKYYLR